MKFKCLITINSIVWLSTISNIIPTTQLGTLKAVKDVKLMTTINQTELNTRQIGDPILQNPPIPTDLQQIDFINQEIKIMLEDQKQYGGIGISANQSLRISNPTQLSIIGTNDPKIRAEIAKRYPDADIPYETVLINPKILAYKTGYYPKTGEGCLSVLGPIRGKVKRYQSISVSYYDKNGNQQIADFSGLAAHVIQHECDHLKGIVFLQKIFKDCNLQQRKTIIELVDNELKQRNTNVLNANLTSPNNKPLIFDRDHDQKVTFTIPLLSWALSETPTITLLGIKKMGEIIN